MTEHKDIIGVTESHESKLGKAKGVERSRIWIEGKRLVAAGFTVGTRYNVVKYGNFYLRIAHDGARKVSGKGDSPIIDIVGQSVVAAFGHGERVKVSYGDGIILIKPA